METARKIELRDEAAERKVEINWLLAAIDQGGGSARVARRLRIPECVLHEWETVGLGRVKFGMVVRLAKVCGAPLSGLNRRVEKEAA